MGETVRYFLQKSNKFFDKAGGFGAPAFGHPEAFVFASEEDALDKAEELGLDLDSVRVVRSKRPDR